MTQGQFFNTINVNGITLEKARLSAGGQEEKIYNYFIDNPGKDFTPYQIHEALFDNNTPLTSIRRAMSCLADKKLITKTENKKIGQYGMINHTWRLK